MPLPVFDTLEAVPEAFREEYEERETDGAKKWHPKVPDTTKMSLALDAERLRAETAERERKRIAKDLADLKRQQEAGTAGITQETLDRWNAEKAAEIAAKEAEIGKRDAELRVLKLDSQAEKAFLDAGGRPEKLGAAMKLNAGRYDLNDTGAVVLMGADGKAASGTLTDHFAKTFRAEMPELYLPSGANGGGAPGGGGGAGASVTAEAYAKQLQDQREARPNPLLPKAS